jgi:SAM-dependent methyltransferase
VLSSNDKRKGTGDRKVNLEHYKNLLLLEHKHSGWGCLLIYRDDFMSFYNGGLCLDIGCNVGLLECLIGQDRYYGLDIIEYDKKPKNFVTADACVKIPFDDEYFDFICMIETLEHLYDPYCALREVHRVLKPNGRLFIQSVHGDDPCAENDPTHFQSFHTWSLTRLLKLFFNHVNVEKRGGTIIAKVIK